MIAKLRKGMRVKVYNPSKDSVAPSLKGAYGKILSIYNMTNHTRNNQLDEWQLIYGIKFSNRKRLVWFFRDEIKPT